MTLNPTRVERGDTPEARLTEEQRLRAEAGAFRTLVAHLQERTDVQNIDLMNLAGFCRNCMSRWYAEAAEKDGVSLDKMEARDIVHGMPFDEWKERYQTEASEADKAAFEKAAAAAHGEPADTEKAALDKKAALDAHAPRGAAIGQADAGGMPSKD